MSEKRIVIFTRFPESGKCKTRLIPLLGADGAAELQRRMTAQTIRMGRKFVGQNPDARLEVRYYGGTDGLMAEAFGAADYRPQTEGSLGRRMFKAFEDAFLEGSESVVIIGSDCPALSMEFLENAFDRLQDHDLVLGPAIDGGYYLIGMQRPIADVFPESMPWGTAAVLKKTLRIAEKLKLSVFLLPELADVDLPQDLGRIYNTPILTGIQQALISVVIPAFNEAASILHTIEVIKMNHIEIIVSDGGSTDGTRELAARAGAKVIQSPRGRGMQLNAGSRIASGGLIVFLHADTLLPDGFVSELMTTLSRPKTIAGAFRLGIVGENRALSLVALFANLRSILFQLPYGDQAIFIRRDLFEQAGGFPDIPIMEDYALILKLKKLGHVAIASKAVKTSGRRWDKLGFLKTLWINQAMIIGYHAGVPIDKLERFYTLTRARIVRSLSHRKISW